MRQFRATLRNAALCLALLGLPAGVASGQSGAQEQVIPQRGNTLIAPWSIQPIHIRYERGPSPLLGNRVFVTARVNNNGPLPVPLVGSGSVRFELEGTGFHKPVSVNLSQNGMLPKGGQVIMTVVFAMSAAEQRQIRYLHIGRADPNLYNSTGVTRVSRYDVPPPLD